MCTLKCQALRNELSFLKDEGEHRDPSIQAPPPRVICHPLPARTGLIETCMIVRLDIILCVSSKVVRYQLGKDVFDKIKALLVVLPLLLEGAQLVRMDLKTGLKDFSMGP